MENKTCKTCKDNDNGLCDRTGQLIDDDDQMIIVIAGTVTGGMR